MVDREIQTDIQPHKNQGMSRDSTAGVLAFRNPNKLSIRTEALGPSSVTVERIDSQQVLP